MPPRLRPAWIVAALALLAADARAADPPEPIRYTLRFPAPQSHYVEVEAAVPTGLGAGESLRPARTASQAVGARTSAVPASETGVSVRPQTAASNPMPNTTCVRPTIETSAGWPAA